MKNLIKNFALITAFLTVGILTAKDIEPNPFAIVKKLDGKLINLSLNNLSGNVAVIIKDIYGEVLYSENFNSFTTTKKYDLSLLPSGNYNISLETETKIKVVPFSVDHKNVDIKEENKTISFKPVIHLKGDLIYVSKLAVRNEKMKVSLYDESSNLIYQQNIKGSNNIGKVLNMAKLQKGKYTVVAESEGNKVVKSIIK